jgi:DUF1365 family protein
MTEASALYRGDVVHRRLRPASHKMRYRVFSLLLDLDELEGLDRRLRLFGHNRAAAVSFRDADHGTGETGTLRKWVEDHLESAGVGCDDIRIRILCYPRIFGYVFNPITVYFCETGDGRLLAVLYEVCNTFHERHTYVIPVGDGRQRTVRHSCQKEMYVSPFVPMDCTYHFRIGRPAEAVMIAINESDEAGPLLYASFVGVRRPLTDSTLLKALVALPLMTLKIMAGIHWEALKLWVKGVPVHRRKPSLQRRASSLVPANE